MLQAMLDTSVCIRVLRDKPAAARARFNAEARGLAISSIVLYELLKGAAKSAWPHEGREKVEHFVSCIEVLPLDGAAADHAADIRAVLERQGQIIGAYDLLIAGHARSLGLKVVTGNLGEFGRVQGLRCEDWLG